MAAVPISTPRLLRLRLSTQLRSGVATAWREMSARERRFWRAGAEFASDWPSVWGVRSCRATTSPIGKVSVVAVLKASMPRLGRSSRAVATLSSALATHCAAAATACGKPVSDSVWRMSCTKPATPFAGTASSAA